MPSPKNESVIPAAIIQSHTAATVYTVFCFNLNANKLRFRYFLLCFHFMIVETSIERYLYKINCDILIAVNKIMRVAFVLLSFLFAASFFQASAKTPPNPVRWETPFARLTSSDFTIRIGNQLFYGQEPILLRSDPGIDLTTLEAIWQENNVEMRLFLYFRKIENNMWELYEIRSYNGKERGDWIYYKDSLGNSVKSIMGYRDYRDSRVFIPTDNQNAEITCKACSIEAFLAKTTTTNSYGYSLEALIGLPKEEIITISTDPMTGYGVNVLLRDNNNQVVTDQSQFAYQWTTDNPQILSLTASTLDYGNNSCAFGIMAPCPLNHVDLKGLLPGRTTIRVSVVRQSDNITIAQTSFPVKIIDAEKLQQISTPNPSTTLSLEQEELIRVKRDLARISEELEEQKKNVNALERLVESIRQFLQRIFGRIFQ